MNIAREKYSWDSQAQKLKQYLSDSVRADWVIDKAMISPDYALSFSINTKYSFIYLQTLFFWLGAPTGGVMKIPVFHKQFYP